PHGWWGWVAIGRARSARGELTRAIEDTPAAWDRGRDDRRWGGRGRGADLDAVAARQKSPCAGPGRSGGSGYYRPRGARGTARRAAHAPPAGRWRSRGVARAG